MSGAYYNEFDPFAAAWLRELIKARLIADGDVDTRSIEDVRPDDLRGYTQCHFFAGIGGWSYALRLAGWSDDRPVWTGSCPCQPFSEAGKGSGFSDERHLWPAFHWLISEHRPAVIFGEQVASKDADAWVDLVQADLEALDYAFGDEPFPAASVGSPHIRDRSYWLAYAHGGTRGQRRQNLRGRTTGGDAKSRAGSRSSGMPNGVDNADHQGLEGQRIGHQAEGRRIATIGSASASSQPLRLANTPSLRLDEWRGTTPSSLQGERAERGQTPSRSEQSGLVSGRSEGLGGIGGMAKHNGDGCASPSIAGVLHQEHHAESCSGAIGLDTTVGDGGRLTDGQHERENIASAGEVDAFTVDYEPWAGPTNGFWRDVDWLFCRDGKWRPVEPGTFPLAYGVPARVGRLRGYGNAINAQQAKVFIEVAMECMP